MGYRYGIFYGWWIVTVGFICLLLAGGLVFYAFGAFFSPLMNEFGWTRARLSGVMTMFSLVGVFAPFVGMLIDKYGARMVMAIGALVTGIAFALLSLTNSIWYFYIVYFVIAIGHLGILNLPILTAVANWFVKRRGLAIGITVTGFGLGGTLMVPLATYLISIFGWKLAYLFSGLGICAVLFPLTMLIIRHRPQEMGLSPYGKSLTETQEGTIKYDNPWTLAKAVRTRVFWLLIAALTLALVGPGSIIVHLIPALIDKGIPAQVAATVLGCVTGVSILGRVIIGYMADRMPIRYVAMLFFFLQAIGLLLLLRVDSMAIVWGFAVVFGLAMGGLFALEPLLVSTYFGVASFGAIYGGLWAFEGLGFAVGPLFTGWVFDMTGTYTLAFTSFIGTAFLAVILMFLVRLPKPHQP